MPAHTLVRMERDTALFKKGCLVVVLGYSGDFDALVCDKDERGKKALVKKEFLSAPVLKLVMWSFHSNCLSRSIDSGTPVIVRRSSLPEDKTEIQIIETGEVLLINQSNLDDVDFPTVFEPKQPIAV
jgi:hypothetical protein